MPIKGLTAFDDPEQAGSIADGLPTILTLRKGEAKPNEKRPGKDLDYFRLDFSPEYEYLRPDFERLYGAKPKSIEGVLLVGALAHDAFPHWLEHWTASTLLHRCDGDTQVRHFDEGAQAYSDEPVPCIAPKCDCKQTGRLTFILPAFIAATGVLGTVRLGTTSIYDIKQINDYLQSILQLYGKIEQVPFRIFRQTKNVAVNMNGKRGRQDKSLLSIEVDPAFTSAKILPKLGMKAALPGGSAPALTGGAHDDSAEDDALLPGTKFAATLSRVVIGEAKNGSRFMRLTTSKGDAFSYTRRPFIDAGWIDEGDWTEVGQDYDIVERPSVMLEVIEAKDKSRFLQLVSIEEYPLGWEDGDVPHSADEGDDTDLPYTENDDRPADQIPF